MTNLCEDKILNLAKLYTHLLRLVHFAPQCLHAIIPYLRLIKLLILCLITGQASATVIVLSGNCCFHPMEIFNV